MAADEKIEPPPKILEERGRGTLIKNQKSQGKFLRYWAWAQTPIEVGVYFPDANWKIEYWMSIVLPKAENEEDPTIYLIALKDMWMNRLRGISNGVAQILESFGNDFGVETRYLYNALGVWFVPQVSFDAVIRWPLAEEPISKDKWYSPSDLMAFSAPPLEIVREEPSILFGHGCTLQKRYPDPEVQGGKIALIAFKHLRAQKPPNCLDRMQSTYLKQVAYNQRVMEAEDGIAGINCDAPHFLGDMAFDSEEQVIICVNSSETMKRNEEVIAGQLWMQGGRQMTASNRRELARILSSRHGHCKRPGRARKRLEPVPGYSCPFPLRTRPANDHCFGARGGSGGGRMAWNVTGALCEAGGTVDAGFRFQKSAPSATWYLREHAAACAY
jgi:hypothetical protein